MHGIRGLTRKAALCPTEECLWGSVTLIALAVFAVGCADGVESGTLSALPAWTLIEDLRLDADAEDFSLVGPVRVGAHGWIAVGLPQDSQMRLYDPEGRIASTLGRRGEGPGEFQHIGPLTWLADTLVIEDARLRRYTFVDLDGRVLRTRTHPSPFAEATASPRDGDEEVSFQFFMAISAAPGDAVLGMASPVVPPRGPERTPVPRVLVSQNADGQARLMAIPPDIHDDRWMITLAGRSNPVPFALQPLTAVSSDARRVAFAIADQSQREGTFTVTVLRLDGDTVFERSYPFSGETITPVEVDSAVAGMTPLDRFQQVARQRIPEVHAPIESIVLALDSTVWVTLRSTETGRRVLVLDPNGEQIALLPLPPGSRVRDASRTHLYVTEADALGLLSVVRYRIMGRN